jgi:hypothetical protein
VVINCIVSLAAICTLGFLGWQMMEHGIDGTLMLLVVSAIAGIAGYNVKSILSYLKKE